MYNHDNYSINKFNSASTKKIIILNNKTHVIRRQILL